MMTAAVSAAATADEGVAAAAQCNISREGGRNCVRDRIHHRLAAAAGATWAAAAAVAAAQQ